ncbi:hypothetical protein Tco_0045374 [Tanacetum coccineum]
MKKTNEPGIPSIGVKGTTVASGSKPRRKIKKDRALPAKSGPKTVENHPRNNKSNVKQKNRVDSSISSKRTIINSTSNFVCKTCNKCLISFNHDKCVVKSLKFVRKPPVNKVWRVKQVKQVWQATEKLYTKSKVVPVKQPENVSTSNIVITERFRNTSQKPLTRYQPKNKQEKIFGLYTSSLLNAACKKALNLLKKGLLIRGEAVEASKRRRACLTTNFNNFSKVQVKDLVLFQRFSMSQRTILVAQAAYFLNLIMKFMMSPMMRKTKLRIQS